MDDHYILSLEEFLAKNNGSAQDLINFGFNLKNINDCQNLISLAVKNNCTNIIAIVITSTKYFHIDNFINSNNIFYIVKLAIYFNNFNIINFMAKNYLDQLLSIALSIPTLLHFAVKHNDYHLVCALIDAEINLNLLDNMGNTALHISVLHNNISISQMLIDAGAKPDLLNQAKQSILHIAIKNNYSTLIKMLILAKCNINQQDDFKQTPLHLAVLQQNSKLIKQLILANADVHKMNHYNATPLLLMIHSNIRNTMAIRLLVHAGSNDLAKLNNNQSHLIAAVMYNRAAIAKIIMDSMPPSMLIDRLLQPLLTLAINNHNNQITKLILQHGANPQSIQYLIDQNIKSLTTTKIFIEANTNLYYSNKPNKPIIKQLLEKNYLQLTKCLISKGHYLSELKEISQATAIYKPHGYFIHNRQYKILQIEANKVAFKTTLMCFNRFKNSYISADLVNKLNDFNPYILPDKAVNLRYLCNT